MDSAVWKYLSDLGKRGGKARLKTMTAEERSAIARKAAKASAKVRTRKAKAKKLVEKQACQSFAPCSNTSAAAAS